MFDGLTADEMLRVNGGFVLHAVTCYYYRTGQNGIEYAGKKQMWWNGDPSIRFITYIDGKPHYNVKIDQLM